MITGTVSPLETLVPPEVWPSDLFADLAGALQSKIGYTDARVVSSADGLLVEVDLAIDGEVSLSLPGVDAVKLVIGAGLSDWTTIPIAARLGREPTLSIEGIPVALQFSRDILTPVDPSQHGVSIAFTATIRVDAAAGVTIETDQVLNLPLCDVANTGVRLQAAGLSWNFNRGQTLPQAGAAGLNGEFIGVAFEEAILQLPADLTGVPTIRFDYCCIGTGGFSGAVTAVWAPPTPAAECQVGGFNVDLTRVALRIQESRLIVAEIEALLKNLPLFDADVAADVQLTQGGGLRIALSTAADRQTGHNTAVVDGLLQIRKPDILSLTVMAAEIDLIPGGGASLRLGGTLKPELMIGDLGSLPAFDVKALTIWSDGRVAIDGGWIDLPASTRISLSGFALQLTRAGLGSEPNGERWVAFSGSLSLAAGIPITAAVDGLKIRWNQDGFVGFELSGIALAFEVEGVVRFAGMLRYDHDAQRFDGAGQLTLIALELGIGARVVIGKHDGDHYFYIYLLLQSPVGVPLFATGLAFYGLEALYARHLAPDKAPPELWYRDWYLRPQIGAVDTTKWSYQAEAQALGAGVLLATAPDAGYSLSTKGLLIVAFPGPVLLFDVRANLLRDRTDLNRVDGQAMFKALVVFDGSNGTFEAGIEPHYAFPDAGELIDISGDAEAFFRFADPRAWHVYLGRREKDKRIRAEMLKLFEANAYLMLDAHGFEVGAFIGYDARLKAGPVVLALKSYSEGSGQVSWRPKQFKGDLQMQAGVSLTVAGIGFGLNVAAIVAAQAPYPFEVMAGLRLHVGLPWPIPDLDLSVKLEWQTPAPTWVTAPLQSVGIDHLLTGASWKLDAASEPVIPLDGRISLLFGTGVNDHALDGVKPIDATATAVDALASGDFRLQANLEEVRLEVLVDGAWQPYAPNGRAQALYGMWQAESDSTERNRRLLLHVRTPYAWSRTLSDGTFPQLNAAYSVTACDPVVDTREIDFDGHANERFDALAGFDYDAVTWSFGPTGGDIVERVVATAATPVFATPPNAPYRCLRLPDQFGVVPVPASPGPLPGGPPDTSQTAAVRLSFAEDHQAVAILVLCTSGWSIEAFDAAGVSLGRAEFPDPGLDPLTFVPSTLKLRAAGIRRVDLNCTLRLVVLTVAVQISPIEPVVRAHRDALQSVLQRYTDEEPVLLPETHYRLTIRTSVVDLNGHSLEDAHIDGPAGNAHGSNVDFVQQFTFQTQGPPGAADLTPISDNPNAVTALGTLASYVLRSVPPAGAASFYRNYDLGVEFNADYVDTMYRLNGQVLSLDLHSDGGQVVAITNTLGHGSEIVLRSDERVWIELLGSNACDITLPPKNIVRESRVHAQAAQPLDQRRRYDVRLSGDPAGKNEAATALYTGSFVSSAYLNFADHFRVAGSLRARPVDLATVAAWRQLAQPAIDAGDPWAATGDERSRRQAIEVHAFDQFFNTVGSDRALPRNVELSVLNIGVTPVGMLLESPEPFDWQRIELSMTVLPSIIGPGVGIVTIDTVPGAGSDGLTIASVAVTLRFSREIDLSNWRLRALVPRPGTDIPIVREFRFGAGAVFGPGARVTLVADATSRWRPSLFQRLIWRIEDIFGLRRNDVPDLTLRDPSDRGVIRLRWPSQDPPLPVAIRTIRDSDGARAIVVPSANRTTLQFGDYTLSATFKRNLGAGLPVLSERGSTGAEQASLTWTLPVAG